MSIVLKVNQEKHKNVFLFQELDELKYKKRSSQRMRSCDNIPYTRII